MARVSVATETQMPWSMGQATSLHKQSIALDHGTTRARAQTPRIITPVARCVLPRPCRILHVRCGHRFGQIDATRPAVMRPLIRDHGVYARLRYPLA
jgi:hypothetical protein